LSFFRLILSLSRAARRGDLRALRSSSAPPPAHRRSLPAFAAVVLALFVAGCAQKVSAPPAAEQEAAAPPSTGAAAPATTAPTMTPVPPPAEPTEQRVEVGLLLPLSGANAELGQALLQAAQMAVFDLGDDRFTLVVRDTEAPGGPAGAAQQLLLEGVEIVLGPIFAAQVSQAAPPLRTSRVPMIAFSTDVTVAGNGVYVMGVLPRLQVERVVGYAASQGLRRVAALAPASAYGQTVVAALQSAAPRFGAAVAQVEYYDPAQTDHSAPVQRLNSGGTPQFDALMLPEGAPHLTNIAPLLSYFGIDTRTVRLLGTALWDDPGLAREPALIGGWFAAPQPEQWESFAARYRALYGTTPPRIASLAYDAAALAAVLGRAGGGGFTPEAITAAEGFAGVDGIFRFRPDGQVERGLAVFEMQATGPVVIDPAPQSFAPAVF